MCTDDDETEDRETETETDTEARKSRVPNQAILDFAWRLAEESDRGEWTTDLKPLTPLSLRFDELQEYTRTLEWVRDEVYIHSHKPRGEDPHPRRAIDVDLWVTWGPVPVVHVRAGVSR